jgi:hypothetical protein
VLSGSEFERSTHNLEPATQKIRRLKSALKFFVTDYGLKSVAWFALGCAINCGLKSILPSSVHASKRDLFLRLAETFHSPLATRHSLLFRSCHVASGNLPIQSKVA